MGTHRDGNAAACCEASASIEAAFHHHCGTRGVHSSHGVISHGDILTDRPNRHVWLHGHEHLSTRVGRRHLRQLTRHLRRKHISGLVYLQTQRSEGENQDQTVSNDKRYEYNSYLRVCRGSVCVRRCLRRHLHSRGVYRRSALLRIHRLLWI